MSISAATATLLGSGIAAGASVGNTAFNQASTRKAREWSEKMYEKQLQDNLRYSSPEFQVARLRAAGLNPMLAYQGEQTVSPSSYPSSPAAQGTIDASSFANIGLVKAQTDLAKAEADKLNEETAGVKLDNAAKEVVNSFLPYMQQATYDNLLKDLDVKDKDIDLKDVSIDQMRQAINKMISEVKVNEEQVKQITAATRKLNAEADLQEADTKFKKENYYDHNLNPNASWQDQLVNALVAAFAKWKDNPKNKAGILFESFIKALKAPADPLLMQP